MVKFLLDASLSPRVARFLNRELRLDVITLQGQQLGELTDPEVIALARKQGRVIITLDSDYSELFLTSPNPIGIIHLDLPNSLRYIPAINQTLADFFANHAPSIDLERSLVVIEQDRVVIHHTP